jgi:phosphoglycolate phosphatase
VSLRAVIFDFDFTLVDSSRGFIESHAHACEALGLPQITDVQAMAMMGTPLQEAFRASFEAEHHHLVHDYVRHWQARADEVMTGLTEMFAEAPASVMALRAAGLKTGIVSQKLRHRIEAVLRRDGLFESFDAIIGGDDMRAFKPDPEGILKAASRVGVTAAEAVYVGDTVIDGEAAANAGVRFVAVLSGVTAREDFLSLDPVAILDGIAGLPDLCRTLS